MTAPDGGSSSVQAEGDRSIAVGHDAIASIFATGDHNQFFVGQYERLADAYLKPWSLYRELELDRFTGREWLERDIQSFFGDTDRGFFILEGEVGVGKTTFLAWLAKERGYLHHFVHLLENDRDAGSALRNLSAQLIRAWDLNARAIGGVLPASASRPDFFNDTLYEASQRRDVLRPGEPIVIVVDGLNEVDPAPAPNQNVLALPSSLPPGVYFILSQRNVYVRLATKSPRRVSRLSASLPENLQDMRQFIRNAVAGKGLRSRLDAEGIEPGTFEKALMNACAGVWTYLYYLMADIESGARAVTDLGTLPTGLWQYYAQYWQSWQDDDPELWRSFYGPLLSTIAVAQERLPASLIASLSGIADFDRVSSTLEQMWRPFLHVDDTVEEPRFGIVHPSLRDFVEGRVDLDSLTSAERAVVSRMARGTRTAHSRIADRYFEAWGGLEAGLPGLRDLELVLMDGGYGLRNLAEHLIASGRQEELHDLLWIGWGSAAVPAAPGLHVINAWRQAHESTNTLLEYMKDVDRAWALAETDSRNLLARGEVPRPVTLELRYALLSASVNSLAANIPPSLLLELVARKKLPVEEAIGYARRGPDPLGRAEALLMLANALGDPYRDDLLTEALAAACAIDDEQARTAAVTRIAPWLENRDIPTAVMVIETIVDEYWHQAATGALDELFGSKEPAGSKAPPWDPGDVSWYRPELAVPHALTLARANERKQTEALARLIGPLPPDPEAGVVEEALDIVRLVPSDRWRSDLLVALAVLLPAERRDPVLDEALASARAVGDSVEHAGAMAALAIQLAALGRGNEAIETAGNIVDPYRRAQALGELAEVLPEPLKAAACRATIESLPAIADDVGRARVLIAHGSLCLGGPGGRSVDNSVLDTISDGYWRSAVVATLIPLLDTKAARTMLEAAFTTASNLADSHLRAGLLSRLAPGLPEVLATQAVALWDGIAESDDRGRLGAALSSRLQELGHTDGSFELASGIEDEYWRAASLGRMAETLAETAHEAGLRAARAIPYPHWQVEALMRISSVLPEGSPERDQVAAEALAGAHAIPDAGARAGALVRLLRYAGGDARPGLAAEALAAAELLEQPHARAYARSNIAEHLVSAGMAEEALGQVDAIADHYWKADALLRIVSHLPKSTLGGALARAREVSHQAERARVLAALMPRFGDLELGDLHQVWSETLHILGTGTRHELLLVLPGLLEAFSRLGGPEAILECAEIVQSVRRWWP